MISLLYILPRPAKMVPAKPHLEPTRSVEPKRSPQLKPPTRVPSDRDPSQSVLMPPTGLHTKVVSSAPAEPALTTPSPPSVMTMAIGSSRTLGVPDGERVVSSESRMETLATFSANPTSLHEH